jgi:hypothetical protein
MIIAGIDEAGYGPVLGPLVVGMSAFRLPEAECETAPCLWKALQRYVSRNRSKTGRKLHINDSKLVYSPSAGLKELERSVLAVAMAMEPFETCEQLLQRLAPGVAADVPGHPWYEPCQAHRFPVEQELLPIRLFANALRLEMDRCDTHCVALQARVLLERPLNRMLEATRNKASALFSVSASHLDYLIRTFESQNLWIYCDRQGGRSHYASLLRLMFPEHHLEIQRETDGDAEYHLLRGGNRVRLFFREKAESAAMPVALASMLAKYLRELFMTRFNHWWLQEVPGIEPTAGYYGDGQRFLDQIAARRQALGIPDQHLIRSR